MVKRITAILLIAIIVISVFSMAFAAVTPTISIASAMAEPGETVKLNVSLSNNPGINTFSLGFNYDNTRLDLVNVDLVEGIPGEFTYSKKAVWLNGNDIATNGNFLVLTFEVLDSAMVGDAKVSVTYNAGDISNYNEDDIDFQIVEGKVVVEEALAEDAPKIVIKSTKALAGDTIVLDVFVENNPGFSYLRLSPVYDKELMTITNVENGDVSTDAFSKTDLNFVWDSDSDATEDGKLCSITINLSEDIQKGEYDFKFIFRESYNLKEDDVIFNVVDGKLTIIDFIYGDVNGDAVVNGKDIVRLRNYISNYNDSTGTSSIEIFLGADANGDGTVNGKDLVRLRNYISNYNDATGSSSVVLGPTN